MNVNQKGAIGLIQVISDLTIKGYECFTPIHDYSEVDLIVMSPNYTVKRLQIKYRTADKDVVTVKFRTTSMGKHSPINFDAIDGWAVYSPEIHKITYISKNEIDLTKTSVSFRLSEGSNTVNKTKNSIPLYSSFGEICGWK